jgi:hypothetical protein
VKPMGADVSTIASDVRTILDEVEIIPPDVQTIRSSEEILGGSVEIIGSAVRLIELSVLVLERSVDDIRPFELSFGRSVRRGLRPRPNKVCSVSVGQWDIETSARPVASLAPDARTKTSVDPVELSSGSNRLFASGFPFG